jgi:CRISPR-associated protein Cst1
MNLDYSGHPFWDVGLATLTAFAHKEHPSALTEADLEKAADYMAANYVVNPLKSFLTVAFPNSGFTQPAYNKAPEKRERYARRVLRAFAPDAPTLPATDPLTGLPAAGVSFDVKGTLEPGRAYRQHVPLLTGEEYINFHPGGEDGIPLSGVTMLAFQALPLGCAKVSGRLLAVHSPDPDMQLQMVTGFLRDNLKAVEAAKLAGSKKLADSPRKARTLLIERLLDIVSAQARGRRRNATPAIPPTLTAYYFTNAGQGAELSIYHLPLEVGDFLQTLVGNPVYANAWRLLVDRGWQMVKASKKGPVPDPDYNALYEDLFTLPDDGVRFIRRYFLRIPKRGGRRDDPSREYDSIREAHLISWQLTKLFLRKVALMDRERIDQIRQLGDSLADYVRTENDRRFFRAFLTTNRYDHLRTALIKASNARVRRGEPPLITLDQFLAVFEEGTDLPRSDWRLGRDLTLIRMLERLYEGGWLRGYVEEEEEGEEEIEN